MYWHLSRKIYVMLQVEPNTYAEDVWKCKKKLKIFAQSIKRRQKVYGGKRI